MKKQLLTLGLAGLLAGASLVAVAEENGTDKAKKHHGKKHHVGEFDKDGDGFISLDEHLAKAKARFAKMDKNNDGKLSKDEMREHHSAMKEKRAEFKEKRGEHKDKKAEFKEKREKFKKRKHKEDSDNGVEDSDE